MRRVRGDALPEHTRYRDDGCDVHPHCLTCPLPRCRYDEPGGLRALLNSYRDRQILELRLSGVPVEDLAGRFRVSRRTVFRILENRRSPRSESVIRTARRNGRNGHSGRTGAMPTGRQALPLRPDRYRREKVHA